MYPFRTCLAALLLAGALRAAAPPGVTPARVARWVQELGDDSFAVREAATRKLRQAGEAAEAAVAGAVKNPDPEIARRARGLLEEFRWGIFPDTPAEVVRLVRSYKTAARSEKSDLIRKLLEAGPHGCKAMARIARYETDPQVRKGVFADVAASLGRAAPALLEEGNRPALEALLEVALNGDVRSAAPHYAAYHLLTGGLPRRIAWWEGRARAAVVAKAEEEVLASLYRAAGDLAKARKAASEAERNDLLEGFLYEAADWKALAARPELVEDEPWARKAGYLAAYSRLAGDRKTADEWLAQIKKRGEAAAGADNRTLSFAKGLFINGRATDAVDLLVKDGNEARAAFEVLVARNQFDRAFAVADRARKQGHLEAMSIEVLRARALYQLGEKARAVAAFKKFADDIAGGPEEGWVVDLVEAELAAGRRDAAFAVAATVLSKSRDNRWPERLFERLFGGRRADDAVRLRLLLRRAFDGDDESKTLARLRTLLEGKATPKEVDDLFAALVPVPKKAPPEDAAEEWRALGEVAAACKQDDQARRAFQKSGTFRAAVRLGDGLAREKEWRRAAEQYLAAYKAGVKSPPVERGGDEGESRPALALYLSGDALTRAGDAAAGRERMERAHLLPLGDMEARYGLAQAYARRGLRAAARREQELLRRLGEPVLTEAGSFYTGEGLRAAALDALAEKRWLRAADGLEQSFLRVLQPSMNFKRAQAYVSVPAFVFYLRARGLVEAGRFDEAKAEVARAMDCAPGQVEAAMNLVPEFDRRGRKADGDVLFAAAAAPYLAVVKAYPRSGWALNQSAWLSACCRRELERGLAHARAAVKLEPASSAYLDTLAEVLFQLGKKEEAVAAEKKALQLSPKRTYFKKQLERMEAGDPKVPRPEEG